MTNATAPEPQVRKRAAVHPEVSAQHDPQETVPGPKKHIGLRVFVLALFAAIGFGGAFVAGLIPRFQHKESLTTAAAEVTSANPRVSVAIARQEPASDQRTLPGNALPLLEASLYARTTGYVKQRLVDIGDKVAEGHLLAVIDSPETDDQLVQATAQLNQARANLKLNEASAALANTTLNRFTGLKAASNGAVSQQDVDEKAATVRTTEANVDASRAAVGVAEATVRRFADLKNFEKIISPFAGVITARHVDPGDLVSADNIQRELFHVMQTDTLRVFVNVPQSYAATIKVGDAAQVYLRDNPSHKYTGQVTRTANALDPSTRTLLTEVQVKNDANELRPGMYLQVQFDFARDFDPVVIPAAALTIRDAAPRVGVLSDGNKVAYRTIEIGRDYGAEVEVIDGLKAGETVVVHPGDDLPDGTVVEPVTPRT
ncbi:MAG TPA: efflux RND transporter periplasmic adaptor subunit [Lacipirellulaceae bacterium]|jgi:RND family efflux transporter MFP subunit|nr:efflux RND transporter periplasmic adaptor subunit [Lacipirellulaceae bacterium]